MKCEKCGEEIRIEREEFTPARFEYEVCGCEPPEVSYDDALGAKCDAEARQLEAWRLKR